MIRFFLLTSVSLVGFVVGAFAIADEAANDAALAKLNGGQLPRAFDVRITDPEGNAISGVTVTPWALRSSQGHGTWTDKENDPAEMAPEPSTTNDHGVATIRYPFYRDIDEQTRTFSVSVNLSHPDFTIDDAVHIDVPLLDDKPYAIEMNRAASIELVPESTAADFRIDQIFAVSSDPSSWEADPPIKRESDRIRYTKLNPGPFRVMLVRLVDGKAVEFSDPIDRELKSGSNDLVTMKLHPAINFRGRLSDDVPRPVIEGRVSALLLQADPQAANFMWATWAAVDTEGNFEITGWPRSETMQVIALSQHFIAKNGKAPDVVKNPRDPASDPFGRPQVFSPDVDQPIVVEMEPLMPCNVNVVGPDDEPISGIKLGSWPNVGWWNWGSQLYGRPLMQTTEMLRSGFQQDDWQSDTVRGYHDPFKATTDSKGKAVLDLPAGNEALGVISGDYQLPIFMGHREHKITLVRGEPLDVTLKLEPSGTETLGEYDKLAGVVFGCSTREGKQICALPEVREKMDDFARRLREADNPRDPAVLAEAFAVVAEAFDRAGDASEAAKWRAKSDVEKAKL